MVVVQPLTTKQINTTVYGTAEPSLIAANQNNVIYTSGMAPSSTAPVSTMSSMTPEVSHSISCSSHHAASTSNGAAPVQLSTAVVTGVPQSVLNVIGLKEASGGGGHSVPHPASSVKESELTAASSHPITTSAQVSKLQTSQVSQPVVSHVKVSTALMTGKPHSHVAPTQVTTAIVTGIPSHAEAPSQPATTIVSGTSHQGTASSESSTMAAVAGHPQATKDSSLINSSHQPPPSPQQQKQRSS